MIVFPPREKREGRVFEQQSRSSTPSINMGNDDILSKDTISNEPRPIANKDLAYNGSSSHPDNSNAASIINEDTIENGDMDLYVWVGGKQAVFPKAKQVLASQLKSKREKLAKSNSHLADQNTRLRYLDDIVWPVQYLEKNVRGEWFEKFGPQRTVMWWLDLRVRNRLHLVIKLHLALWIPCIDWSPDVGKNQKLAAGEEKVTPVTFEEARHLELEYENILLAEAQILKDPALDIPIMAKFRLESLIVDNPNPPVLTIPIINSGNSQPNICIEISSTVERVSGSHVKFSMHEELLSWTISRHQDRATEKSPSWVNGMGWNSQTFISQDINTNSALLSKKKFHSIFEKSIAVRSK